MLNNEIMKKLHIKIKFFTSCNYVKIKEKQRALPGLIAQKMEELIILSNCCGY